MYFRLQDYKVITYNVLFFFLLLLPRTDFFQFHCCHQKTFVLINLSRPSGKFGRQNQ